MEATSSRGVGISSAGSCNISVAPRHRAMSVGSDEATTFGAEHRRGRWYCNQQQIAHEEPTNEPSKLLHIRSLRPAAPVARHPGSGQRGNLFSRAPRNREPSNVVRAGVLRFVALVLAVEKAVAGRARVERARDAFPGAVCTRNRSPGGREGCYPPPSVNDQRYDSTLIRRGCALACLGIVTSNTP